MTRVPPRQTRMLEIAELAGVSVSTVSRALMGSDVVNAATRSRVQAAADELGYTVNQVARSLRTQKTWLVLAIVPDIGNPFYSYVLAGIEEEAQRLGYSVLIGNVAGSEARARRYGERLLSGAADGVILMTGKLPEPAWFDRPGAAGLPVVALCERIEEADVPFVGVDDQAAGADITRELLRLGHRRIAHVTGPLSSIAARDRYAGYLEVLEEIGIAFDPSLVAHGDFTIDSGYIGAKRLCMVSHPPTAIFCANDEMAIGAVNALRDRDLQVPKDVSVAGCDGLELSGKYFPPITTMEQPRSALGAAAMTLLHDMTLGKKFSTKAVMPTTLVRRLSTGRVRDVDSPPV